MADRFNKKFYLSIDNNPDKKNIVKIVNNDSEIIQTAKTYDSNTKPVVKFTDNKLSDNPIEVKTVQNMESKIELCRFRTGNHRSTVRRAKYRSRISRIRRFTLPPTSAGPTMPPTKPPKENDSSPTLINKEK